MGSSVSSPSATMPLAGPMKPVAAINPCFCHPVQKTLRFKRKPSQDAIKIRDALTNKVYFQFGGSAMRKGELQDHKGDSMAFIRASRSLLKSVAHVSADPDGQIEIMTVRSHVAAKASKMVEIRFRNIMTGKDCDIGIAFDLNAGKIVIWMDELATHGTSMKMPIAHFQENADAGRKIPKHEQESELTVAPNVDIAMVMVAVLAMMDHRSHDAKG